jgi:tetratricopeptide (TPR) repeat protein
LRQAVNEDSLLAVAALRGAQAASWKNRIPEALQLAQTALADVTFLPERQVDFARGLAHYLNGRADSAVHWLSQALRRTPDWAEAHMALGEVYQHLLPIAAVPLDSLARQEFAAAARDTGFAPPHFHLAELAIRSHDLDQAKRAVDRFDQFGSASEERMELDLMLACLERREAVDWRTAAREAPLVVLGSAKMLSVAGSFPGCAEDGTRALRAATTDQALNWGAFLLLENLLAIAGRDRAIISLVDSVRDTGLWQATTAYLIGALAGTTRFESKATETVAAMAKVFGPHYEDSLDGGRLLLLGTWYARTGRTADAKRLHARLVRRAASSGNSEARLFADALQAHVLLARGDSDAALIQFQKLAPIAGRDVLLWGYAESLPVERLTEARLLFSRHRYWAALAVAEAFDHPTPIVYLTFLPASLALRYRAAQALGQSETAAGFKERLLVLGRADLFTRGD